jgi:hypothetical protein
MATICYAWDDADFSWDTAPITWIEGCLIQKIQEGGAVRPSKVLKKLTEDEKRVLVGIIVKLRKQNGYEVEVKSNKVKNKNTKVTIKEMELFIKEVQQIKVKVVL